MANCPFFQQSINVDNRLFLIQILKFDNGNFISISEGTTKLGSMVVSLSSSPIPITTTVIPAKTDSLFLKLVAEKLCYVNKGITIASSNIQNELKVTTTKTLMVKIEEMIQNIRS